MEQSEDWHQPAKLDREMQFRLLRSLADAYPQRCTRPPPEYAAQPKTVLANLLYLDEHGLCVAHIEEWMGENGMGWGYPIITAKGLDFLADDGGLHAILSVITVRFDAATLRQLINKKIDDLDEPEETKSVLKEHLKALPEAALKAGTTDLVATGLEHLPNALHWLQRLVGL